MSNLPPSYPRLLPRLLRLAVVWQFAMLTLALEGAAPTGKPVSESELKVAFLPKVSLFVQWPAGTFKSEQDPIVIGFLGGGDLVPQLKAAVAGRLVAGRELKVVACRGADDAMQCHMVYLVGGTPQTISETLRRLSGSKVLTVGDARDFARLGGMVSLITDNRKIRLEVNLEEIQRADLRIDPQLLQLATTVKTAPGTR
jgi:hypothetical protein